MATLSYTIEPQPRQNMGPRTASKQTARDCPIKTRHRGFGDCNIPPPTIDPSFQEQHARSLVTTRHELRHSKHTGLATFFSKFRHYYHEPPSTHYHIASPREQQSVTTNRSRNIRLRTRRAFSSLVEMDADGFYFILENRLDSFQGPQPVSKGKASTAGGRGSKATSWPHKTLSPAAVSLQHPALCAT